MNFLKKIWPNLLHCFLIPVFFIVHNAIDFYGLISLKNIRVEIIVWLLLPALLFAGSYFFLRDKSKAGFFSSLLLLTYFFSVPLFQSLKKNSFTGEWIKLYVFLLVLVLLLLLIFFLLQKNKLIVQKKTHTFLYFVFSLLLIYDVVVFLFTDVQKLKENNLVFKTNRSHITLSSDTNKTRNPDIYYFLFDMHGSTIGIQKSLGYDNSALDENLKKMNFSVANNSTSASNYTPTSMAAVFNMSSLPFDTQKSSTFREMYQARNSIRFNALVPFLQKKGYKVMNASSFPIYETDSSYLHHIGWGHPEELLVNQTLPNFLWKTFNWVFIKYFSSSVTNFQQKIYTDDLATINNSIIRTNAAIALKDSTTPKFVYTHLYIPHPPFKYDSVGTILPWDGQLLKKDRSDSMFMSQLKYCRKLILDFAQTITSNNVRPAIIIFQGDHGIRDETMPQSRTFEVLHAMYLPDKNHIEIDSNFYTPNTFRIILNKYFHQQLPMLEPKNVFITLQ